MKNATAAVLEPVEDARVALVSVDVETRIRGLLSDTVVAQTYRNLESRHIEAVYTFPLPLEAVLLELTLDLNGTTLRGSIRPHSQAESDYEDALDSGDSALLLRQLESGLYTVSVGNLHAGETATVRFRYSLLHRWQDDQLRFHLPTTVAPRYGDPAASGLASHEIPESALSAEYGFSLQIHIEGALAQASCHSPSHAVSVSDFEGVRNIALSGGTSQMDRDFVLVIKGAADTTTEALWAPDQDAFVALASFHPAAPRKISTSPRNVTLIVDCSGSMSGDSIAQAKEALHEILALLKPNDRFNLMTFGSHHQLLFPEPVSATGMHIRTAAQFIRRMEADMGGTELGAALEAAYQSPTAEGKPADLLLITDGEVWEQERIIRAAQASGQRIFSVGVGSAVSEGLMRQIAETTSGACELVSPRENLTESIVRQFRRMDQPKARDIRVVWPDQPTLQSPSQLETIYAGDTLHLFGWFETRPEGQVRLEVTFEDGTTVTQAVWLVMTSVDERQETASLPRMAASTRSHELTEAQATELAVRYQLITEHTSCVLVCERDEARKVEDIPKLRTIPHTLAAGWGGIGTVSAELCLSAEPFLKGPALWETSHADKNFFAAKDADDTGATVAYSRLVTGLNERYADPSKTHLDIGTISELIALGMEPDTSKWLRALVADGHTEAAIVTCFLAILSESVPSRTLSRHVIRLIRRANKQHEKSPELTEAMSTLIQELLTD